MIPRIMAASSVFDAIRVKIRDEGMVRNSAGGG